MINLTESVMLDASSVRRTTDGYLVAQPRVARTGIQTYSGREVGKPELDSVRVYRPEAEVFSDKTMRSATHRPVTIDHPPEMVSANNWRKYSRGQTGDEVHRDGNFIRVPMILMDSAAISEWDSGKKEISMGYTCDLAFEPGVTPEGEKYDAVQRNIRMNHLAIVGSARGGADLRLGDEETDQDVLDAHYVMCPECGGEVPEHAEFCPHCGHDMSTTDNEPIYDLDSLDTEEVFDFNPNHYPAGSGKGGQFASSGGSSGRAPRVGKKEKTANRAAELTKHGYFVGHSFVKGQKGGRYQVTHPDKSQTGHIFENKESAVAHAESHARANKIGSFAVPEPSHEKHAMLTAARELGGDVHEMFKGISGHEGGHDPLVANPRLKSRVFKSRGEAKAHIRAQRRHWIFARPVPVTTTVPLSGLKGWVFGTKFPGLRRRRTHGYTVHHTDAIDHWEIVFDEIRDAQPLTDADLTEVFDYNENHDPKTGEFTSGSIGIAIGPGRFTVGELMAASRREAGSSTFSSPEFSKEHAAKQLETWKKYLASQEAALLEIKKQKAMWEKAKIHPHYEILPKTSIFQLKTPKRVHYTVHIDSVPDVELTESDWIAAREIDAQMQIEANVESERSVTCASP